MGVFRAHPDRVSTPRLSSAAAACLPVWRVCPAGPDSTDFSDYTIGATHWIILPELLLILLRGKFRFLQANT